MRRLSRNLAVCLVCGGLGLAAWLAGCAANDPFDPDSVPNQAPKVTFFVGPVVPGGELNATSYFQRTFRWSGTDPDGWVTEYRVSIRDKSDVPAPWVSTTRTDTIMTFTTGEDGTSEATFYIVCRDNRGALSDTLVQFVPLRNFPPVVNFQSDFDPLVNMQRLIDTDGAVADTTYWNWGVSNFRLFALDLDGASTMDSTFQYTVAEGDPALVVDADDPAADPNEVWIRAPFTEFSSEVREFEIRLAGARPGERTLKVKVGDEAGGEALFSYDWEVRAPQGRILYVFDNTSTSGRAFYREFLNDHFGEGNWDSYDFWFGFPDNPFVLLGTLRLFDAVLWTDGGANSNILVEAAGRDGAVQQYVEGTGGNPTGKFMLVTKAVAGVGSTLPHTFIQAVLGISPSPAPPTELVAISGRQALGEQAGLPDITVVGSRAVGLGILPLAGTEALYRMEYCTTCYGDPNRPRPPFDPVVAVRKPERTQAPYADVLTVSLLLDQFDPEEAKAALAALIDDELGVGQ